MFANALIASNSLLVSCRGSSLPPYHEWHGGGQNVPLAGDVFVIFKPPAQEESC